MPDLLQSLASIKTPRLMGILNITPDSFSDGARFFGPEAAISHAEKLIEEGADILDIGAESTRPGSDELFVDEEIHRLKPVLSALVKLYPGFPLSIDTRHAQTAALAIEMGVKTINDVSALTHDPEMAPLLAGHPEVAVIMMHIQGTPRTMQDAPCYEDLFGEIKGFFTSRIGYAESQGIDRSRLMLDPGIGFGKNLEHNLSLIANMSRFQSFGLPLVLGASRKSFIGKIHPSEPQQRICGSLAAALCAFLQDVAILRVHDVAEHLQFFDVLRAIAEARA